MDLEWAIKNDVQSTKPSCFQMVDVGMVTKGFETSVLDRIALEFQITSASLIKMLRMKPITHARKKRGG